MNFANRISKIKESPTFAVLAEANSMINAGHDVVILATGEPDFDTPDFIKEAAIQAIRDGKTKYTTVSGIIELRRAVVNKFIRENELIYDVNEVIVSTGGKQCIYNALQAIINDGDEVIIPAPYWVSYPDMVLLAGGIPIIIDCDIEQNFKLTPTQLKNHITHKTKAIFMNSPNNPTGMIYTHDELLALAEVLQQYPNIYIISDDLYEHLLFNKDKFVNLANVMPNDLHRIIVINGVSKSYCMTGWRIGYAACKNITLIKAMNIIQSQSTSNPCSIAQYAALSALNGGIDCIAPMKQSFIERHEYVISRLQQMSNVRYIRAQGAFYIFFDCNIAIKKLFIIKKITTENDIAFTNFLLKEHGLAVVAGSAFGLNGYIRCSFATSMEQLIKGFDRLEKAINV